MQANNINNHPSFCGVTRYLEREIYDITKSEKRFLRLPKSEFVGQLPHKIIQDITKTSKNSEEKRQNIFTIMNALSNFAKKVNEPYVSRKSEKSFWQLLCKKFKPKDYLDKKLRFSHSKKQIEELRDFLNDSSTQMSQVFKKAGLIKKFEKIKIEYLGKGCSGKTFRIIFPKRTGYNSKVMKIFDKSEFTRKQRNPDRFNLATPFHEINSMLYIKNAHKKTGFKDSEYVEGYFASLKNKFMLVEDVYNYPQKEINAHAKLDHDLQLILWDKSTEGNVLNGRLVDYGYIQMLDKTPYFLKLNPNIRK